MKKLTFKVSSQKDCSVISLIKEINTISCRIYLDIENNFVVVENVNDTMIDTVIELVENYYTILGVDIDNTCEEPAEEQNISVVAETGEESATPKQTTVLEPQSEDHLIIKKVEFENELVENRINNFLKTAYWALYNKKATEKEISEYILTCHSEISMRYLAKPIIDFSIGDIVDVTFGSHLPGEIMGGHVHAIVCHILNDNMAYVVPITKAKTDINSQSYLLINTPEDATYDNESYPGGTALLDKGRYVRVERFNYTIGKTKPAFFEKLLYQLASAFDFTDCLAKTVEEVSESFSTAEHATDEIVERVTEVKSPANKVGGLESALLEAIGPSFDNLDKSKSVEEQVEGFMTEIGMTTAKLVAQSFVIACDIKKINYENIISKLHTLNPDISEDIIKVTLQETFKSWLEQYPTLAEKCPKISLMSLLKVFAKRFE